MTSFAEECSALFANVVDDQDGVGELISTPAGELSCVFRDPTTDLVLSQRGTNLGSRISDYTDEPCMWLVDADAALLAKGQTVTRNGRIYQISSDPQPNGGGFTRFALAPAQASDPTGATTWR